MTTPQHFVLAVMLGLRRGELLGLRLHLVPPKTMPTARMVPLPALCVDALRPHLARQDKERTDAGVTWQESGLVFTSQAGTPLESGNLLATGSPCRPRLAYG